MTVLSDFELKKRLNKGDLIIHPLLRIEQIHGIKIDLRLDNIFLLTKDIEQSYYDPIIKKKNIEYTEKVEIPYGQYFVLHPGQFILAPLFEHFSVPEDLLGRLDGRSSFGRLGVIVHQTAGIIDPGYRGSLMLELSNGGKLPVALYPYMIIATVTFETIIGDVQQPYYKQSGPKYLDKTTGISSKLSDDPDMVTISKLYTKTKDVFEDSNL
jgi:dCTP deaminase